MSRSRPSVVSKKKTCVRIEKTRPWRRQRTSPPLERNHSLSHHQQIHPPKSPILLLKSCDLITNTIDISQQRQILCPDELEEPIGADLETVGYGFRGGGCIPPNDVEAQSFALLRMGRH